MGDKPVLYECDRAACKDCSYPTCHMTIDVTHAENFQMGWAGTYVEKKKEKSFTGKMITAATELLVVVGLVALGFKIVTWVIM